MAFARDRDIELSGQPDAHGPPCFPRAQSGYRGERIRLDLLSAERASHTQTLDGHLMASHAEHTRDHLLRFRRMLSRRMHGDASRFVYPGEGGLRLQIEMLLSAYPELSIDPKLARVERGSVAVDNPELAR